MVRSARSPPRAIARPTLGAIHAASHPASRSRAVARSVTMTFTQPPEMAAWMAVRFRTPPARPDAARDRPVRIGGDADDPGVDVAGDQLAVGGEEPVTHVAHGALGQQRSAGRPGQRRCRSAAAAQTAPGCRCRPGPSSGPATAGPRRPSPGRPAGPRRSRAAPPAAAPGRTAGWLRPARPAGRAAGWPGSAPPEPPCRRPAGPRVSAPGTRSGCSRSTTASRVWLQEEMPSRSPPVRVFSR